MYTVLSGAVSGYITGSGKEVELAAGDAFWIPSQFGAVRAIPSPNDAPGYR